MKETVQRLDPLLVRALQLVEDGVVTRRAVSLEVLDPLLEIVPLGSAADEGVPLRDERQVLLVQLVLLHQHVLAHAHLPEVVQETRVLDLTDLVRREGQRAVRPGTGPIDGLRQLDRAVGHAL